MFLRTPDGAQLWYEVLGPPAGSTRAPPLILCDGLGCDGFAWKHLSPALAATHPVVHAHYRGHGKSGLPQDTSRVGVELSAEDLAQVLDAAGVSRAVLIGHSMGVQVMFELYRRHPERVQALVAICGAYGHALDTFHDDVVLRKLLPWLRFLVEHLHGPVDRAWKAVLPTDLAVFVARHTESSPNLLKAEDFLPYLAHLASMDPRVFLSTLASAAQHSAWPILTQIQVPTLLIAAERDRFTPMWLSERMHATIPGSELLVLPRASHCAPIEMPELIGLRIERFFRDRLDLGPSPSARPSPISAVRATPPAAPGGSPSATGRSPPLRH